MMNWLPTLLALLLGPLMLGLINRTKAVVAGRRGQPLLQAYFDIVKLLQKAPVYSTTTSWIFRAGPIVTLAGVLTAMLLLPFGGCSSPIAFAGDLIVFVYLLAVGRFFMVAAALDTGSPFEGMGASREVFFSALAEPALLFGLAAVAGVRGSDTTLSLSAIQVTVNAEMWSESGLVLLFVAIAFAILYLAENSRIPVDDPNTHLELTMIHEVMILDHSGPDLGFLLYAAALKLWILGALIVGLIIPRSGLFAVDLFVSLAAMGLLAVFVGVIESTMARLRMVRVPQLLVSATALAMFAVMLDYHA